MRADFTRRINDLIGFKRGTESRAGDQGAPGAQVGAVIILHR